MKTGHSLRVTRQSLLVGQACLVLAIAFALASSTAAWAQKPNPAQEKKDAERIKEAQLALAKAKERLGEVQKAMNQAADQLRKETAAQNQAEVAAGQAREAAQSRLDESPAIQKALAEQERTKARFDELAEPILTALKESTDYQQLLAAAETARGQLRAVTIDPLLSPEDKSAKLSELNRQLNAPAQAQQAAVAANAPAATALAAWRAAQSTVNELRGDNRDALQRDPKFVQALGALQKANQELGKARAQFESQRQNVARQQKEVASRQQAVSNAQLADKKNDNDNKPKGDNKKK